MTTREPSPSDAAGRERELLPCPFCGTAAKLIAYTEMDNKPAFSINCDACDQAGTLVHPSAQSCTRAWNVRAPSDLAGRQQTTEQQQDLAHSGSEKVAAAARDATPVAFDDLVEYGRAHGANIVNGMPWSFTFNGLPVTHENDNCYLIGSERFERGDLWYDGRVWMNPPDDAAPNLAALPDSAGSNISNAVAVDVEVAAAIERMRDIADHIDDMERAEDGGMDMIEVCEQDVIDLRTICDAATRAVGPPQPKCIDEWACMMPGDCSRAGKCLADDAAEAAPGSRP